MTAAALPPAGLTALRLLRTAGSVLGRRLLPTGVSGGVGHYFAANRVAAHLAVAKPSQDVGGVVPGGDETDLGVQAVRCDQPDQRVEVLAEGCVEVVVMAVPDDGGLGTAEEVEEVQGDRSPAGLPEPDRGAVRLEQCKGPVS
ncbi:hypothetical protein [Embleya sp. NBC_00888]|uniref:hypothetical protein n=1 Tax=Embleya sp. NBC_00888 TaxID=2975960 RepID=UPI00386DAC55